jgi:hypothetical protein
MTGHGDGPPPTEHQLVEVDPDAPPPLDETVGPHSPASDDVSLSASDVTSDGVMVARQEIQDRERAAERASPPDEAAPVG